MKPDHIFISKDSLFQGVIHAKNLTVEGVVTGEVNATGKVFIKKGALIDGPIQAKKILLEEGGKHNGVIKLGQKNKEQVIENVSPSSPVPAQEPFKKSKQVKQKKSLPEPKKQDAGKLW